MFTANTSLWVWAHHNSTWIRVRAAHTHTHTTESEAVLNLIPWSPLSTFTAGCAPSLVLLQGNKLFSEGSVRQQTEALWNTMHVPYTSKDDAGREVTAHLLPSPLLCTPTICCRTASQQTHLPPSSSLWSCSDLIVAAVSRDDSNVPSVIALLNRCTSIFKP